MPNWTENRVEISGNAQSIKELKEYVKDGDQPFSFNKIMPMPTALCITSGSSVWRGLKAIDDEKAWLALPAEQRRETRQAVSNRETYGQKDWYDWCNFHWGTKWDACGATMSEPSDECVTYSFRTAWSGPQGVARTLRQMFPELDISWQCLNEEDASIRNESVEDDDADDAWVCLNIDENPNTYDI